MTYGQPSPFPPSFDGNPWAYGFGLFGDLVAASFALVMVLAYLFEARRTTELARRFPTPGHAAASQLTLLTVYRTKEVAFWLFVFMRAAPDAVWMLIWGEVSEPTIRFWLAADLWCDGLALTPLFLSVLCWAWGRQPISQRLIESYAFVTAGGPPWEVILRNARIIALVLAIAVGVTFGKVGG
jgi:hypothetical protein